MDCHRVKELLSQHGVHFEERNIARDPAHLQQVVAMGYFGVPVTVIGEQRIAGFDRRAILTALAG